jgi:hypothetical protein
MEADVYAVVRTYSGAGASRLFDVCAEQSMKVARDWIQKNAPDTGASAPAVTQGTVLLQIK